MAMLKVKMADGGQWVDVTLANVSPTGFMAKAAVIPSVGEIVHIQHRGTEIKGEVVWTTRTRFGVRSLEEIDLSTLLAKAEIDVKASSNTPRIEPRWWHWRVR